MPNSAYIIKDGGLRTYHYYEKITPTSTINLEDTNATEIELAQAAKGEYHQSLRKQKKQHWEEFLDEPGNIWDTCRYPNNNPSQASFAPISQLQILSTIKAITNAKIAQGFLTEFFPPLPAYPPIPPTKSLSIQLPMSPISAEEITHAVFSALPLKGAGHDGIPAIVWQKLWPTIKEVVISLFLASISISIMPDQ